MPTAYEGKKPYIFVSYSHLDKKEVMGYIAGLEKQGFRVWFDGGIEAGSEWPEFIADRLSDSACVLAFISENFVESRNCRRELAFSQELEKQQLNVYIKKVELSNGMRMQLGLNQAIWRENFSSDEEFVEELCDARLIAECRETPAAIPEEAPKVQPQPEPAPEPEPQPQPQPTPKQAPQMRTPEQEALLKKCKRLGWWGVVLEILYVPISIELMSLMSFIESNGFWMFLNMIIPHTVIALINKIAFARHHKKLTKAGLTAEPLNNAALSIMVILIVATLCSIVGGALSLYYEINFFLCLLITLGLNVVPFCIAGFITLFLAE